MTIDKNTVVKTAKLAHINVDGKLDLYKKELDAILNVIDTLSEVNTDSIDPLVNVDESHSEMRKDEITDGNYPDKIFANSPKSKLDYFLVPKVID